MRHRYIAMPGSVKGVPYIRVAIVFEIGNKERCKRLGHAGCGTLWEAHGARTREAKRRVDEDQRRHSSSHERTGLPFTRSE